MKCLKYVYTAINEIRMATKEKDKSIIINRASKTKDSIVMIIEIKKTNQILSLVYDSEDNQDAPLKAE